MPDISVLLATVHDSVHDFRMKRAFSEPKIYTGGVDITYWKNLSPKAQNEALDKDWHVYYSYRDPVSGYLKRQPNIKAGANRIKSKQKRWSHLKTIQKALSILLEFGFNPYEDNTDRKKEFWAQKTPERRKYQKYQKQKQHPNQQNHQQRDLPNEPGNP